MGIGTRYVHQVRIKKGADPTNLVDGDAQTYVDMEITDAISFISPNGQQMVIDFSKLALQAPYIIDNVGAGVGTGDPTVATRKSHMVQVSNPTVATSTLFIEVLDVCAFISPNGKQGILHMIPQDADGTGQIDGVVDDQAGIGIMSIDTETTRRGHTIKVVQKVPEGATAPEDQPDGSEFIGVVTMDAISFIGENGQQNILDTSTYDVVDSTIYTTDIDGNQCPPAPDPTVDLNTYVKFPGDPGTTPVDDVKAQDPWVGIGIDSKGVAQGMIWRIVNAAGPPGPYWFYVGPPQQEYNWTMYVSTKPLVHYGEFIDGLDIYFKRLPVVGSVQGIENSPTVPKLPKFGYPDLNSAALANFRSGGMGGEIGKIDMQAPPTSRNSGIIGLIYKLSGMGGWQPNVWQVVGRESEQPPLDPSSGLNPLYGASTSVGPYTGVSRYLKTFAPSQAMAKDIANTFLAQWNKTSKNFNTAQEDADGEVATFCVGVTTSDNVLGPGIPCEGYIIPLQPLETGVWAFGISLKDGLSTSATILGNVSYPADRFDFCGGLMQAAWRDELGGPMRTTCDIDTTKNVGISFPVGQASLIQIGKLDPRYWDWTSIAAQILGFPIPKGGTPPPGILAADWPFSKGPTGATITNPKYKP